MSEQDLQEAVAGAVRAEMARAQKRSGELARAIGLSRATISGRLSGAYPFTVAEIDKVAQFLGITPQDILSSAALGARLGAPRSADTPPLAARAHDPWAQPPGSHRRRGRKIT